MSGYVGHDGRRYELGRALHEGAEGVVYEIAGVPGCLAKVYKQMRFDIMPHLEDPRGHMRDKIERMLEMQVGTHCLASDGRQTLVVAWPLDTLSLESGEFAGFVMPRAKEGRTLAVANNEALRDRFFFPDKGGGYTWRHALTISRNLAQCVAYLHEHGVAGGDFNPRNLMVAPDCSVVLVDVDSFTIEDRARGRVYKCMGGRGDVLAPELQGRLLTEDSSVFTKESDRFSLAVHIFKLLTGFHPFNYGDLGSDRHSSSAESEVLSIAQGECPYVRNPRLEPPRLAPDIRMLPDELRDLVDRAFAYDVRSAVLPETLARRPTAQEWMDALGRMKADLVRCTANPGHVYLGGNVSWPAAQLGPCPWCERERRLGGAAGSVEGKPSDPRPSDRLGPLAGNGTGPGPAPTPVPSPVPTQQQRTRGASPSGPSTLARRFLPLAATLLVVIAAMLYLTSQGSGGGTQGSEGDSASSAVEQAQGHTLEQPTSYTVEPTERDSPEAEDEQRPSAVARESGYIDAHDNPTLLGLTSLSGEELASVLQDAGWSWRDGVVGFNSRDGGLWTYANNEGKYDYDEWRMLPPAGQLSDGVARVYEVGVGEGDYEDAGSFLTGFAQGSTGDAIRRVWIKDDGSDIVGLVHVGDAGSPWLIEVVEGDGSEGTCALYAVCYDNEAIGQGLFNEYFGTGWADNAEEVFDELCEQFGGER